MSRFLYIVFTLIIFTQTNELFSQGCSQCKMIPQSNMNTGGSIAANLNPAILYLMAVPYVILVILFRKQLASLYKSIKMKK